ncbi:MAG: tetratricopeptide repeat protein [Myxococcales bacterium]|nr:tetratricopeptide repeat protein [Myxococcales bacterium]
MSDDEAQDPSGDDGGETAVERSASAKTDADEPRRDLPKWNRARVKRKAPAGEQQDAFQASVRRAGRGFMQRPWAVIGVIVALAGAGAGVYAWLDHREAKRAEATAILATAVAYEARGQVEEDIAARYGERTRPLPVPVVAKEDERRALVDEALSNLEDEASGYPANIVADLVRAARLARALDYEGAEKAYRGFLQGQSGHPLEFLARDGLIITLEAQGRWDDALAEVEPLMGAEGDFFRDQALWHKGRLLEGAGRTDEATEAYKQYVAEYPLDKASLAREQVRARLEVLDPSAVPPLPETPAFPGGLGGLGGMPP